MDPAVRQVLSSWSADPLVVGGLVASGVVYARGFRSLRRRMPAHFPGWRCGAFFGGMGALALALATPLDAFAELLLQVHMAQHWLLTMVAPPLLWLGAPFVPLLRGLPRRWRRDGLAPFLTSFRLRRAIHGLTRPIPAWLAWALAISVWHWPAAYQAALRSPGWHDLEHASFFAAALLFWFPVIAPWPARRRLGHAGVVLYLGGAAVFNTIFAASFAFSDRVFYPSYEEVVWTWGIDPLADQNAAGALLWVAASVPMVIAAMASILRLLEPPLVRGSARPHGSPGPVSRRPVSAAIARRLRAATLRRAVQWSLLGLAACIVIDGLMGPQRPSALNLAGVLPWTYWRGFTVIALLLLGNLFCAVCPLTLPRSLAGRWLGRRHRWPAALRNKWLATALFVVFLWSYEVFSLWDSPWWTAWIIAGYFAASFLVEGFFPRGTFCRYACPLGQFHFTGAGVSPLEVQRRRPEVCTDCRTHDCLKGNESGPGCPTGLFLPTKRGNLDCTFCLDCVRACPHDNAGLVAVSPGAGLGASPRPSRQPAVDGAALALAFCFGAFANAAAMVGPVAAWGRSVGDALAPLAPLAVGLAATLVIAPPAAALACAGAGRLLARVPLSLGAIVAALAPSLVPLGFAMWLSHFGFHLVTGIGTLSPAVLRAGRSLVGAPLSGASVGGMAPAGPGLEGLEIAVLGVGLVVGVGVAWRLARELAPAPPRALALVAPWLLLNLSLYALGVWLVLQPMQMRGTLGS